MKTLFAKFPLPVLAGCLALLPALATAGPICSAEAVQQAAAAIAEPREIVRRAIEANTDLDTDLQPVASAAIVTLKTRLLALVDAQVACLAAGASAKADGLDAALAAAVRGAIKPDPAMPSEAVAATPSNSAGDADAAAVQFESALLHDGALLSVVAQFGIPCGSDALWLLYAVEQGHWHRVVNWTSPRYSRVDGAWGSFQYAVSPPAADGRWFAAAAHIRPWCSSSWSVIDYAVLRPGSEADRPAVVLSGKDDMWWGGDDIGRLSVDATHVELRFHGASIDSGVHNREFIRRYDVSTTTPLRVPPIANSARDFVDEWIVSSWAAAQVWSAKQQLPALKREHEQLRIARKEGSFEFGATLACADGKAVQVEIDRGDDNSAYFRVTGATDFAMVAIADKPDPLCVKVTPPPAE